MSNLEPQRTCLILNPNAGSADQMAALKEAVAEAEEITCWETAEAEHGIELAGQALAEGYDCIAAAGGDGTINEVVNGLLQAAGPGEIEAVLGVVPLGTGNDLARTLALPEDPRDAVALLLSGARVETLDAMRVETGGEVVYGTNAAAGGFSGQVDEVMTAERKKNWGPLAYLFGAADVLPELREYETLLAFDDGAEEQVDVLNVIVANGRTAAGGHRVAPLANPCDGLLDVVIVRGGGGVFGLAEVAGLLAAGNYLESENVLHRKVRRARVRSRPGMWFNIDGELLTKEPVTFAAVPGALRVVVGPDFVADALDSEADKPRCAATSRPASR